MHAIDTFVPWFTMVFHGTRIVVTSDFISEVLQVPRMDRPDYPSHRRISSISRNKLASLFCEKAMLQGGTLNFSTTKFTKDPRILNIMMNFVLTPQSHYNTITEPHAHFLLSLMERLSIDFPSDCYRNTVTHDKLIHQSCLGGFAPSTSFKHIEESSSSNGEDDDGGDASSSEYDDKMTTSQ